MVRTDERITLVGLLVLALLNGWVWMGIVPPWQHYDEPAHFMYAAELAHHERIAPDSQARMLSREVADSMYRHRFYAPGVRPDLAGPEATPVGISQRSHPPLYYALTALPIRLTRYLPIETQLYAARSLSLGFYMLTILVAWRIAVTVLPDEPRMQLIIPLLVLLTPTFADIMTAVNNDVLVNFAAMSSLLGAALLIRDGPRLIALLILFLSLLVALLAKRLGLALIIPSLLALFWAWQRQPLSRQIWLRLLLIGLLPGLLLFVISMRPGLNAGQFGFEPRTWLNTLDQQYLRLQIGVWLGSITDWERSLPLYQLTAQVSLIDLWGRFAWGHIGLGQGMEWAIALVVGATGLGLVSFIWRAAAPLPVWQQRIVGLFGMVVIVAWIITLLRIHPLPAPNQPFYVPRGRYLLWSMLPHLWLLTLGWQMLFPASWRHVTPIALLTLFAGLNLAAWFALIQFYASPEPII